MKWKITEKTLAFEGFFKFWVVKLQHSLFSGGTSREIRREVLTQRPAIAVLPYDPKLDVVLLIEQFRIGPALLDEEAWLLEVVGGLQDEGETVAEVAFREAKEEAGCELLALEKVAAYYASPGYSTEWVTAFIGLTDASNAGGVFGLEEEGEDIRVQVFPAEKAFAMMDEGEFRSSSTVVLLQALRRERERLQEQWTLANE